MANGRRRHFGVLCSTIDISNQYNTWKGIAEFAAANDISLTAYICTYQTTDNNFHSYLESCFDTMFGSDTLLDGVILLSGFIAQNVGLEEFNRFTSRLPKGLPAVSISFEIEGVPSVITHNESGMYSAIDHLIRVHGKRHIAFVKGPDGHPEAEARLMGYKNALAANGIALDENYLFPGDFGREGGRRAVTELYDVRRIPVDAFACCNDQSAVGVLHYLKNRNIMVPGDVAVTGFDNDLIASIHVPAIGTVGQDFVQLGRVSAELLLRQVNGEAVEDVVRVTPEFISRQSCGCLGKEAGYAFGEEVAGVRNSKFNEYVRERLTALLRDNVPGGQIDIWIDMLLSKLSAVPFNREDFLTALDRILVTYYHSYSTEFAPWHKALIVLAKGLELFHSEFEFEHVILSTLTFATTLVFDIRMSEERKREYNLNDERIRKRRNTNALLLMFDMDTLAEELLKSVSELSLSTALIGIFRNSVKQDSKDADRSLDVLIGFDGKDSFNLKNTEKEPISFSDYSSIKGFDFDRERRAFFFQPLFFMEEEVGVMLLPYDPEVPTDTYETLRINISTAIKGAQLMSTIHTLSVTDDLTGLLNRRGFFQFTYSRLYHLRRNDENVSMVMFLDMDGLKQINDNYGHSEGDTAIRVFAEILKATMREEDIIGRIGGDEFAALSSVKSRENAKQLEDRLRRAYDEYNEKGLHPYRVESSIGCVILEDASKECFESAMLSADSVLYEEKMQKRAKGISR